MGVKHRVFMQRFCHPQSVPVWWEQSPGPSAWFSTGYPSALPPRLGPTLGLMSFYRPGFSRHAHTHLHVQCQHTHTHRRRHLSHSRTIGCCEADKDKSLPGGEVREFLPLFWTNFKKGPLEKKSLVKRFGVGTNKGGGWGGYFPGYFPPRESHDCFHPPPLEWHVFIFTHILFYLSQRKAEGGLLQVGLTWEQRGKRKDRQEERYASPVRQAVS